MTLLIALLLSLSFTQPARGRAAAGQLRLADAATGNTLAAKNWSAEIRALIGERKLGQAETMIVGRMVGQPRNPELITLLAEVRLDQGRFGEALTLLNSANKLEGGSAFRTALAGLAHSGEGRLGRAEPDFRRAISLDPGYAAAHYFLARLLYTQNRFDESISESKRTISLSPKFVRAYENLGLCYEAKQQFQKAERWYLQAIGWENEGGMRTEWPALDLATMLIRQNRTLEARKYLAQALNINPRNRHAWFEMGVLLEKTGDLHGALQRFNRATELDASWANVYYRMARIYERLGDKPAEERDFAMFRQLSEAKHNPPAQSPLARDHPR